MFSGLIGLKSSARAEEPPELFVRFGFARHDAPCLTTRAGGATIHGNPIAPGGRAPVTRPPLPGSEVKHGEGERLVSRPVRFSFQLGSIDDAPALAALHTAVAEHLTGVHGRGGWSTKTSEKGVLFAMRTSQVFVARQGGEIVATLRLATKKPWAIDTSYFTKCRKPLYLLAMAVKPTKQRQGIGTRCLRRRPARRSRLREGVPGRRRRDSARCF